MRELKYTELKKYPQSLNFETTQEIEPFSSIIGQSRASKALEFGLQVKSKGYNIYVTGSPGTGKTSFARAYAGDMASKEATPPDLCYIYNFKNPKCPQSLWLPPGMGRQLKDDMDEFIARLLTELPKVFSSKEYEAKKADIVKSYQAKRDELIKEITDDAKEQNFGVKSTNTGIYFMPIINGELINEEQFDELTSEQKDEISKNSEVIQKRAAEVMRIIKEYERSTRKEVEDMEYALGLFTVGYHISSLLEKYAANDKVLEYLLQVKEDILEFIEDFVSEESGEEESIQNLLPWYVKKSTEDVFSKYKINLITDNSELKGAPVIVDFNPTYANLIGEIEYDNEFGNFTTDFMKIRSGLLHRANGGYLILQAHDILSNIHAWEALRRVMLTGEIVVEPIREFTTGVAVSGIKPEPVPVSVKIILIGSLYYYDILYEYDEEFQKLFKIRADFDYEMSNDDGNIAKLAGFVKKTIDKEGLLNFTAPAVMRLVEYSTRLAERQDKLTAKFSRITEIIIESSTYAKLAGAELVGSEHVDKALFERQQRLNMYEEKLNEMIEDNVIMIDVTGKKVGEINGLAILDTGDYIFGKPTKITATAYVGKAGIINIEKEAEMSGSIHDKGVQVLIGYLDQTYAQEFPLSLSCRICFEQNYHGVDGDSASSTELYSILSMLSGLPINQELAVTGSINQRGEIQPIGGVTYKIEGFFELCANRGLTGNQGVIIPVQNVKDLVLKDEVIEAVKEGKFHIYAIDHIDEGIQMLTGVAAGKLTERGKYPVNSVHGLVYKKLKEYHKKAVEE